MEFKEFQEGISYYPLGQKTLVVELLPDTKLHLLGKCEVLVLKGSVTILGFELLPDHPAVPVFSPKGHSSLLTIQPLTQATMRSKKELADFLRDHQTPSLPEAEVKNMGSLDIQMKEGAVIALMGFEDRWCEGVRTYCVDGTSLVGPKPQPLGLRLGYEISTAPQMSTLMAKLGFRFIAQDRAELKRILQIPSEWSGLLDSILATTKGNISIATFGGKGVGKSTFGRWLINQFLSKFNPGSTLFVDLDIGQTEVTPPGVLSVSEVNHPFLGPNFTHLRPPLKAVYIGTVNASEEPHAYLNGMKELARFINSSDDLRNRHLILNTMGFCNGLGVNLAVETIMTFQPKSVIQIHINNRKRCYPFLLTPHNVSSFNKDLSGNPLPAAPSTEPLIPEVPLNHKFFQLESPCSDEKSETSTNQWGMTPKDLREITMVSYFAGEIGGNLLGTRPQVLSTEKVAFGSKSGNYTLPQILEIINGSLVALCAYPEETMAKIVVKTEDFQFIQFEKGVAEVPIEFFGYGIVRGIDGKQKKIFITTPINHDLLLNSVNCILGAGTIGMPATFYGLQESSTGNRLHSSSKKQYVPNRSARSVLANSLL